MMHPRIRRLVRPTTARRDHGFTLMETIVALAIFTALFIALERGTALGWRGIRLTETDAAALNLARAKLASAGIDSAIPVEAAIDGDENGLHWRVAASRYVAPEGVALPATATPYWVTVTVSWRDRAMGPPRLVELTTLKHGVTP